MRSVYQRRNEEVHLQQTKRESLIESKYLWPRRWQWRVELLEKYQQMQVQRYGLHEHPVQELLIE